MKWPMGATDVQVRPERVWRTSWKSYVLRFLLGGVITAATGLIASQFGPVVGGLFLAFPAILPASMTLVAKHSGKRAAGDGALGAVAGSMGLLAFGTATWLLAEQVPAWLLLPGALLAWLAVTLALWWAMEMLIVR